MMTAGVGTVIVWNVIGYDGAVFKILPGMAASFAVWGISLVFGGRAGSRNATEA